MTYSDRVVFYAVRKAESWPRYRVVPMSRDQAFLFGERKPYVFDTKRQAYAVLGRVNGELDM